MRKIKFRAWDEEHGMLHDIMVGGFNDTVGCLWLDEKEEWVNLVGNEPVMQYTGLKDKNGKEIYEGDVVEIDGGGEPARLVVSFQHGCFGVVWTVEDGNFAELKYYTDISFCRTEIIGNIYENPELNTP